MVNGKAGKGDRYRPVDSKSYRESWERIFGNSSPTFATDSGSSTTDPVPAENSSNQDEAGSSQENDQKD